ELQKRNCVVFIASSGRAYELLKKEFFLTIRCFEIDGYDPIYPDGDGMVLKMLYQVPKFLKIIAKEQLQVEKIVERNQIDVVISDNRYGCYSTKAKSIFISHQLHIQMPALWKWIEKSVNQKNHEYINKFSECWIPAPEDSFVSLLTKNENNLKARHIGYLSRFEKMNLPKKYDVCAICSGPEPQRSNLDNLLMQQLNSEVI
ncbi:MAG: glycosyltransferase, partial [Chloroflexi bacterium]|nr:glycosyltransferase [Chloroflexota bacterium]